MGSGLGRWTAAGSVLLFALLANVPLANLPLAHSDDSTVRDFVPRGTKVGGLGTPSGAPVIGPGLYRDTIGPVGDGSGVKYYSVKRTPGSITYFSTTARPPKYSDQDEDDGIMISVRTQSWDECTSWASLRYADEGMRGLAITDLAVGGRDEDGETDACHDQSRIVLELRRGDPNYETPDATEPLDFELQVVEEPAVRMAEQLPEPADTDIVEDENVPPGPSVRQVPRRPEIGTGFSDAVTLAEGTARDAVRPGEVRFYRVRADWGQSVAVSVRMQPDSSLLDDIDQDAGLDGLVRIYNPVRSEVLVSGPETYDPDELATFHAKLPEIRYRNREADSWQFSTAGYYYVALELERHDGQFEIPIEVSAEVTGTARGRPEYVGLGTPKPVPPDDSDSAGNKAAAWDSPISLGIASAGGVLVLIGVVLGALYLRRSA